MLLLKNCRIVNYGETLNGLDILIKDGNIALISEGIEEREEYEVYDLSGFIVAPGLIDIHVHLREPGQSKKETIKTGTKAALKGGFTYVVAMPNTNPKICDEESLKLAKSIIEKDSYIDVSQSSGISIDLNGEKAVDFENMYRNDVKVFTDDGYNTKNIEVFKEALKFSKDKDVIIMSHCEDHIAAGNFKDRPTPIEVESDVVKRDIEANRDINGNLHVTHMSSKKSMEYIKNAKNEGIKVTCDVTPHHFSLNTDEIEEFNTLYKVNPPIRNKENMEYIIESIKNGTVDIIASDHAPHEMDTKKELYSESSFGISGIETSFFLGYTELVKKGHISINKLIELYSYNPSKLLNLDRGEIKVGLKADISVFDLEKEWNVNPDEFISLGKNTPFKSKKLFGKTALIIKDGKVIYKY